jgi:hypothetical protein
MAINTQDIVRANGDIFEVSKVWYNEYCFNHKLAEDKVEELIHEALSNVEASELRAFASNAKYQKNAEEDVNALAVMQDAIRKAEKILNRKIDVEVNLVDGFEFDRPFIFELTVGRCDCGYDYLGLDEAIHYVHVLLDGIFCICGKMELHRQPWGQE